MNKQDILTVVKNSFEKITHYSDPGSPQAAIVAMKLIAFDALKALEELLSDTKEVKSADQVLKAKFNSGTNLDDMALGFSRRIIEAMEEYAAQFQSVSKEQLNEAREQGWDAAIDYTN